MTGDVVVLRTGRLHEADLVANTFDEKGIPYYRGYESIAGLKLAMPLSPVQGPGDQWVIRVPGMKADEAKALIDTLNVYSDQSPGVWAHGPSSGAKRFFRGYAWVTLAALTVGFVLSVVLLFGE